MSKAANPNKPKKTQLEIEADIAVQKQDADRERIRRCIITLGDENRKVVGQIRAAVAAIQDDVELHGELITTTVLDCAKCLPIKLGIYAAWCARMAEKHPQWAVGMVNKTLEDLGASVQAGHLLATQLLLRFMVFLANTGVLGVTAVVDLLLEVFALSKGLKSNEGGDFGAFAALGQLPFFTSAAYNLGKDKILKLIAQGEKHLATRNAVWKSALRIFKSQDSLDRLEELLHAVKQLSESWTVQVVLHVPGFSPSNGLAEMPVLSLAVPEQFRPKGVKIQVPLMSAQLLTAKPHGQMVSADRWVVENYILLVVEMFAQDVQECSKQILRIPVLHPDFESIAVETLFSELLRLPAPSFLPLFYCRLLEACAEKQNSMVKLIEDAFQSLFQKLSEMDDQCLDQLAEIFACHLANTAYKADWKIFTSDDAKVVNPATQHFARRTLDCLQQLSDYQNMLARLPQAMCTYAPAEPLPASGLPVVSKPQFGRLINLVRLKDANVEKVLRYCHWLMKLDMENGNANGNSEGAEAQGDGQPAAKRQKLSITDAEDFGEPAAEPLKLEEVAGLVMSVMLQQGHKTPTHMAKILDGHEQLLLKLKPSHGAESSSFEQVLVKSVFDFWKASALRLEITLDSLIQRNVISPAAVAEYALSHELGHSNHWNVVKQVARKSLERSQRSHSDLAVAKKLGKEDLLEKCQAQVDGAAEANDKLFRIIFTSMVCSYEDADVNLRGTLLARIMSLSRQHVADIKPLVDAAESQIPRVKDHPDIAAVFKLVSTLA